MRFIVRVVINAIALWVAHSLVAGISIQTDGNSVMVWLILGLIFGVVNALIRPIAMLLTCPFRILTLGLFTLVVNALMLMLTSRIARLFDITFTLTGDLGGIWPALLGGIVISIVSIVLSIFVRDDD